LKNIQEEEDYEEFLDDLERDEEYRSKINLYKDDMKIKKLSENA